VIGSADIGITASESVDLTRSQFPELKMKPTAIAISTGIFAYARLIRLSLVSSASTACNEQT
jgi:hypothetical protein